MFQHLLVPLDGSRLAEAALPAARFLAEKLGATVTLVHMIERSAPQTVHGERHLIDAEEATAYLEQVSRSVFPEGTSVACHVHTFEVTDVARAIVDHLEELKPDMIILCTHGSSGLRELLLGSIAQQVISLGSVPVLLVRPSEDGGMGPFVCRRILVPLDGTLPHEQGLPVARDLARVLGAEIELLSVVPTVRTLSGNRAAAGRLLPGATTVVLELLEKGAQEYLERHIAALGAKGIAASAQVSRGDPIEVIVKTALEGGADLIVLGTHAKSGMEAFWAGSVAPRVSSRTTLPLLLVPIKEN